MPRFYEPQLPKHIWEQPPVRAGQVYNKRGNLIDIHSMRFTHGADDIPIQIELVKDDMFELTVVDRLGKEQLHKTYTANCEDAEVSFNSAVAENNDAADLFVKGVGAGTLSGVFTVYSICEYVKYASAADCMNANVTTSQQTCHDYSKSAMSKSGHETMALGVGAAILGVVTFAIGRAAIQHLNVATAEFTKVALAIGNIRTCQEQMKKSSDPQEINPSAPPALG